MTHNTRVAGDIPSAVKQKILAPLGTITIGPLTERFDPLSFFKNRKGLGVWNDMDGALSKLILTDAGESITLESFDISRNAYDSEIKTELPERYEVEF